MNSYLVHSRWLLFQFDFIWNSEMPSRWRIHVYSYWCTSLMLEISPLMLRNSVLLLFRCIEVTADIILSLSLFITIFRKWVFLKLYVKYISTFISCSGYSSECLGIVTSGASEYTCFEHLDLINIYNNRCIEMYKWIWQVPIALPMG